MTMPMVIVARRGASPTGAGLRLVRGGFPCGGLACGDLVRGRCLLTGPAREHRHDECGRGGPHGEPSGRARESWQGVGQGDDGPAGVVVHLGVCAGRVQRDQRIPSDGARREPSCHGHDHASGEDPDGANPGGPSRGAVLIRAASIDVAVSHECQRDGTKANRTASGRSSAATMKAATAPACRPRTVRSTAPSPIARRRRRRRRQARAAPPPRSPRRRRRRRPRRCGLRSPRRRPSREGPAW